MFHFLANFRTVMTKKKSSANYTMIFFQEKSCKFCHILKEKSHISPYLDK